MAEALDALRLTAWLSPGYPVGAYAYSHGLEAAVEAGAVRDEASLLAWLTDVAERGALRNDLILAARALALTGADDPDGPAEPNDLAEPNALAEPNDLAKPNDLAELNDLALALAPSRELHLETSQQGRSFLDATLGAWPCPGLAGVAAALPGPVAYPVALGACAGAHRMAPAPVLAAYALAFTQNLVSAALRTAPVGQAAGTRIVAALAPRLAALAGEAAGADLDALGSGTLALDLGSFRHETQYSRIFRS